LAAAVAVVAGAGLLVWTLVPAGPPGPPPASLGNVVDLPIPASLLDAPLVDQQGRTVTLSAFRGRILVLVPVLTSCQEECPITTGALLSIRRDLSAAGLGPKVVVAEASVDPARDVPSRMSAYAALTGTSWPLLTGPATTMSSIWQHFGVYAKPVPEGNPPGIDWQTGRPYTYDVNHSDGFILIGPNLHERFITVGAADLRGSSLEPSLSHMLSDEGVKDLRHPPSGSWTVPQALSAIGWLAGRNIPASP
jgi:cytochrome oxidase Cu insertion factor (SCO1/SenC/PrrC family)